MTINTDNCLRTDWIECSVPPLHVGEYEVSWSPPEKPFDVARRWWNGRSWSRLYYLTDRTDIRDYLRRTPMPKGSGRFLYRGLVERIIEPSYED